MGIAIAIVAAVVTVAGLGTGGRILSLARGFGFRMGIQGHYVLVSLPSAAEHRGPVAEACCSSSPLTPIRGGEGKLRPLYTHTHACTHVLPDEPTHTRACARAQSSEAEEKKTHQELPISPRRLSCGDGKQEQMLAAPPNWFQVGTKPDFDDSGALLNSFWVPVCGASSMHIPLIDCAPQCPTTMLLDTVAQQQRRTQSSHLKTDTMIEWEVYWYRDKLMCCRFM